jgi:hypothetical protein
VRNPEYKPHFKQKKKKAKKYIFIRGRGERVRKGSIGEE